MIHLPSPDAIGWGFALGGLAVACGGYLFAVGWILRRGVDYFYESVTWRMPR